MRKLLFFALLLSFGCFSLSVAQKYNWLRTYTPANNNLSQFVEVSGNRVIVAGLFQNSISFGTTVLNNQNNVTSIFIASYDTNGVFQWAIKGGSDQNGEEINGLEIDENGNIYIIGSFTFGPTIWGNLSLPIQGSSGSSFARESFVVKLNSAGNPQWIKGFYNATNSLPPESLQQISIADSSIYIVGRYSQDILVTGSPLSLTQASSPITENFFMSKFDLNGNLSQLDKIIGNSGAGFSTITDLEAIDQNSYYLSGSFGANYSFGTNSLTFSNPNSSFAFVIAKYTGANCDWLNNSTSNNSFFGSFNIRLEQSASGDLWFAGAYSNNFSFLGRNFQLTFFGQPEWFYGKLTGSGSLLDIKSFIANSVDVQDIVENSSQELILAGSFSDSISLRGIKTFSNGSSDHLIVSIDSNYAINWYQTGGGANLDFSYGIAAGNSSTAYVVSNYQGLSQFGSTFLTAPTNRNASLLFKIGKCGNNQTPISLIGDTNLCAGQTVRIIASPLSPSTFQWLNNGIELAGEVFRDLTVSTSGNYQVIVNGDGCSDTSTVIPVTVDTLPNVNLSLIDTICRLDSPITLSGGSPFGGIYSGTGIVSDSIFDPSIAGIGNTTIKYIVSNGGCSDSSTTLIYVKPGPSVFFAPLSDICINSSPIPLTNAFPLGGSFSGAGVSGNQFDPALTNGGPISINYTFSDPDGCTSTASQIIRVDTFENSTFSEITDLCINNGLYNLTEGSPAGGIYEGIGVDGSSFDPQISGSGTFTLAYIISNQCGLDTSFQTIIVEPSPLVNLPSFNDLCANDPSIILNSGTPSGGVYSGTGVLNSSFDPGISGAGTFTVFYDFTDSLGCSSTDSSEIVVNPVPNPVITNDTAICTSDTVTLSANGGISYLWNDNSTTASISVSPLTTSTYSVTVSSVSNCSITDSIEVIVNPLPIVSITGDSTICEGSSATLTASGGFSYLWNTTETTASIAVNPLSNTTYSVIVTDGNSCATSASQLVAVNPLPFINLPSFNDLCANDPPIILNSGTPSGGIYSGIGVLNSSFDPGISGAGTFTVFYDFTDSLGCSSTDSSEIVVNPLPNPVITNDTAICTGDTVTLSANGGISYLWNDNSTTASISVSPLTTSTYSVTVSSVSNCSITDSIEVIVNPLPTLNTSNDTTVCIGESITLTASSNASNFLWNTTSTSPVINVNVFNNTIFTVLVQDSLGCTKSDSISVTISTGSPIFIGNDTTIGFSESVTYDAGPGFLAYLWQDGSTNQSININYDQTKAGTTDIIFVFALNSNGCNSVDTALVTYDLSSTLDNIGLINNNINLFPNPTNGKVTLKFEKAMFINYLKIYTYSGKVIQEEFYNQDLQLLNLNLHNLKSGLYFIEINSSTGLLIKKIQVD